MSEKECKYCEYVSLKLASATGAMHDAITWCTDLDLNIGKEHGKQIASRLSSALRFAEKANELNAPALTEALATADNIKGLSIEQMVAVKAIVIALREARGE